MHRKLQETELLVTKERDLHFHHKADAAIVQQELASCRANNKHTFDLLKALTTQHEVN
jgi:hypothetical protein